MALAPPTFTYPLAMTESLCTDDPEDEESIPAGESMYLANATESSILYSDYAVTVTVKTTSTTTVSNTAVQAVASSGNGSVAVTTTFTTSIVRTTQTDISESITTSGSTMKVGPAAIYTPAESPEMSTLRLSDPTSVPPTTHPKSKMSSSETNSLTLTIANSPSITTYCSPTEGSSQEIIPGTTISYVNETTTMMADQSTSTIAEMASTTNAAEPTSTTTLWTTSTTTTDVNTRLWRTILITGRRE
jgi:hypothetical protein